MAPPHFLLQKYQINWQSKYAHQSHNTPDNKKKKKNRKKTPKRPISSSQEPIPISNALYCPPPTKPPHFIVNNVCVNCYHCRSHSVSLYLFLSLSFCHSFSVFLSPVREKQKRKAKLSSKLKSIKAKRRLLLDWIT